MFTAYHPLFALLALIGISGCTQTPEKIPHDAKRSWSLKSEYTWTWTDKFAQGCIVWLAKPEWATVQVLVDSQCEGDRTEGYLEGKGLGYSTVTDRVLFRGYWPWSYETWSDMLELDEDWVPTAGYIHPCPYSLTEDQIDKIEEVVTGALSEELTESERSMLKRLQERLASTNGKALSSSPDGCTDRSLDPVVRASTLRVDPWSADEYY